MNDHMAEVDQDPRAIGIAFHSRRLETLGSGALDDAIGDCASLNFRTARDDCKCVSKNRASAYVDGREIFALFLQGRVANDVDQFSDGLFPLLISSNLGTE